MTKAHRKLIRLLHKPSILYKSPKQLQPLTVIVIVIVASIGTYLLSAGHAASPYASETADKGSVNSPAVIQACNGANDGNCVHFGTATSNNGGCPQFQETSSPVAFCDTLSNLSPDYGTRSNELSSVWGVSNLFSPPDAMLYDACNLTGLQTVPGSSFTNTNPANPGNEIIGCDSEMDEAMYDNQGQNVQAMYVRQPFNFANATASKPGDFEVNVSDDTAGSHSAWPSIAITNTPTPAPFDSTIFDGPDFNQYAEGVDLVGQIETGACPGGVAVILWAIDNYTQEGGDSVNPEYLPQTQTNNCVLLSTGLPGTGPGSGLNHIELLVTPTSMAVYASAPGSTDMKLIAYTNPGSFTSPLPNDQGLVWLEDEHYNANKFSPTDCSDGGANGNTPPGATSDLGENNGALKCQGDHTFGWSDFAFNGPILPRDLAFDVPNNTGSLGTGINGHPFPDIYYTLDESSGNPNESNAFSWTTPSITASQISTADPNGCLFLANTNYGGSADSTAQTITLDVNTRSAATLTDPITTGGDGMPRENQTTPIPFSCSDLHSGANTITLQSTLTGGGFLQVGNMDLILKGAGGVVTP